jgi:hypothetical protein
MLKKEVGWLGRFPCSRNARLEKALVGRAQLGSSQPPLNRVIVRCGLADSLYEHPATLNVELRAEEIAMKESKGGVLFVVGLLTVAGLFGCGQETPVEKTKAAAASSNAATRAAGQAAVDAIKTPMDKALQAESTLEQSAEDTAVKIKESTQ